jgi:hypothetical protein
MKSKGLKNITRIMWTGNQKGEPVFDPVGFWKAAKQDLESMFRVNMGVTVFAYNYIEDLRSELEMYGTAQRVDGAHFDIMSSCFVGFFVCNRYIGDFVGNGNKAPENPEDTVRAIRTFFEK